MRWLKHMTASHDDEKLADLIARYGHAGYGTWWLVLEIVAARLESGGHPSVTYHVTKWSHLLSLRGSHVLSTLLKLDVTHLVTVVRHGDEITVTIPNLLKYRDEYTRKSGQATENVPPRTDTDTHTEAEAHTQAEKPSVRALLPSLRKPTADDLNGQASQRFDEWFTIWAAARGNAYRMNACSQYVSVVMAERENDVMECTRSYVAGPGADSAHGYRPDRFLAEMARDSFKTRWPAQRAGPQRQETPIQAAIRKANEAKNGSH